MPIYRRWLNTTLITQHPPSFNRLFVQLGMTWPQSVRILMDNKEHELPISEVQAGNIIIVKPGERIPVDGVVVSGSSYVDESTITGEAMPAEKSEGKNVFTGTINQKGSFRIKALKVGNDTALVQIIKTVQEAQGSKAPVQKQVDRIASIFVPSVMLVSLVTFGIRMLAGGEDAFSHALLASITVLVIACPCALGLATPTAIMVGMAKVPKTTYSLKMLKAWK